MQYIKKEINMVVKYIMRIMAAVLITIGFTAGCAETHETPDYSEHLEVSTMDGYTSQYHPANLSSAEAWDMFIASENAVIIDVRTEESFLEYRVDVAVNVPYDDIGDFALANIPDKDRLIITYCFCDGKGGPALSARDKLTDLGYTNVFYTDPGEEWTFAGTSISEAAVGSSGDTIITGEEARDIFLSNDGVILLDVRSPDEYSDYHIDGSINIPYDELDERLSELPDKEAIIIVYCRAGRRSAIAFEVLISNGYTNVFDMQSIDNWP